MFRVKLLLMCAMGLSTGILAKKIQGIAETSKMIDHDYFEIHVTSIDEYKEYLKQPISLVLVGPQVAFKYEEIKKTLEKKGIPTLLIDEKDYGMMDASTILKKALIEIRNYENKIK